MNPTMPSEVANQKVAGLLDQFPDIEKDPILYAADYCVSRTRLDEKLKEDSYEGLTVMELSMFLADFNIYAPLTTQSQKDKVKQYRMMIAANPGLVPCRLEVPTPQALAILTILLDIGGSGLEKVLKFTSLFTESLQDPAKWDISEYRGYLCGSMGVLLTTKANPKTEEIITTELGRVSLMPVLADAKLTPTLDALIDLSASIPTGLFKSVETLIDAHVLLREDRYNRGVLVPNSRTAFFLAPYKEPTKE